MSKFETDADRLERYIWTADSGVDVVERGTGPDIDLEKALSAPARAEDADGRGPRREMLGLDVVIETPKGYERHGKDWSQVMPYDYGYLPGMRGADGDSLDVCVGDGPNNGWAYVVDQRHVPPKQGFDEHKVMLNYPSMEDAIEAYHLGHHRAFEVYMDVTPIPVSALKEWARSRDMKKPASEV